MEPVLSFEVATIVIILTIAPAGSEWFLCVEKPLGRIAGRRRLTVLLVGVLALGE